MYKLYKMTWNSDSRRKALYFKSNKDVNIVKDALCLKENESVDLLTYFNSFSLCKWKKYTTIYSLIVKVDLVGKATFDIVCLSKDGRKVLSTLTKSGTFELPLDIFSIDAPIIGLVITAVEDCVIKEISYYGSFTEYKEINIGVSICTFKREEYVKKTIEKLMTFSNDHPWLKTLVVDNGSTLQEVENSYLRIVHNPNFGGSGGFARGLIENLERKENDYVLLMDDDIDLETSSIERMYALLCGLRKEYQESFLSGAMLRMDNPCIQHENTAYWGKIRLHSLGKGWDLSKDKLLLKNEEIGTYVNHYGAWWYCCIPLKRVEDIGLPLPVFVKGDDIEYSIRNEKELIHINGIGVWHEAFESKQALWVNYFSDRNMLIINQYAYDCNRWTFFIAIIGRLIKRSLNMKLDEIQMLEYALNDAFSAFEGITSIGLDKKLCNVRSFKPNGNYIKSVMSIIVYAFKGIFCYSSLNNKYKLFRSKELSNTYFWKKYMLKWK